MLLLLYNLWKTAWRQFRSFSMHCKCKTVQPLVLWVTKVFVTCVRLQTQPKICQKMNLPTKHNFLVNGENIYHTISIYGKTLIIEFSYNFLDVWNCMKLYEKKLPIYENCMISIFGQPRVAVLGKLTWTKNHHKLTHFCLINYEVLIFIWRIFFALVY